MTPIENQAPSALANVLHDQGVPNTISGIGMPTAAAAPAHSRTVAIVLALAGLGSLLAVLAARAQ